MPIKGLTDEGARKKRQQSYWSGILHKGTRKIKRQDGKEVFGKDLERFFRFEPKSELARDILMRAYPEAKCDQNGDIILQELDIFAATSEIASTFWTGMREWDGSVLKRECDRETISLEAKTCTDIYGHVRTKPVPCKKRCAIADEDVGVQCPLGCVQEGALTFYLYLPQMLAQGLHLPHPCKMTVSGYTDLTGIDDTLLQIEEMYGSIKSSPIAVGTMGNVIPLKLRRVQVDIKRPVLSKTEVVQVLGKDQPKRTGKKTDATTWAVSLEVNPHWVAAYEAIQQAQIAIAMGARPSAALLQRLPIDMALEPAVEVPALPPSQAVEDPPIPIYASDREAAEIWAIAQSAGWTKEALRLMLLQSFGIAGSREIPIEKLPEIAKVAGDRAIAGRWLSVDESSANKVR